MTEVILENPPTRFDCKQADNVIYVLHVDDERGILETTKQILEIEEQFQVESANSVDEALEKIEEKHFDAIISDYEMPKKNGLDLLRELRESDSNIPYILFTGKGREEVAIKALNLGADYYLNKNGKPVTIFGELSHILKKVVKQSRTEIKLDLERKRLQTVTKNMSAGLAVISKDYRILWANDVLKQIFGDIYTGKNCYALINKLENPCLGCGIKELFEKNKDVVVHEQIVKDIEGNDVWLEITVTPIKDPNGRITAALELVNNITERKKYEKQLEDTSSRLQFLLDTSKIGIGHFDLDGNILLLNRQARKYLCVESEKDFVGKHVIEVFGKDMGNLMMKRISDEVKESKHEIYEDRIDLPSGTRWFLSSYNKIVDSDGRITGVQVISDEITEGKNAEIKNKRLKEEFESYVNLARVMLIALDSKGRIAFINNKGAEILETTKQDAVGKEWFSNFLPRQVRKQTKQYFNKLMSGKINAVEYHENSILAKNGSKRIIRWRNTLLKDESGKICGVLSSGEDITERKKAKEKLIKSEAKYRNIVELSPNGILVTDIHGIITDVNNSILKMTGYSRDDLVGKNFTEVSAIHVKDIPKYTRMLNALMSGKTPEKFITRYLTKSGTKRMAEIYMNLMKEEGKTVGIQCLIIDITDHKNKEKQISSLAKFPSEDPNPVLRVSKEGKVLYANKAAEKHCFRFDRNGIKYIPKELQKSIVNSLKSGCSETVELERGTQTFSFVVAPIPNEDYANIYGRDITESKNAESLLEKTMNDLVKINEKLNVVGKFTRHDTRNKLSVIANNAYLAKIHLSENHKAFEYLVNIESALDHVEKILSFSKTYEMVGVEKLSFQSVEKCLDEAAKILDHNNVKIINECKGLEVYADSLLRQIFYNLMDNSLKHGETVTQIKIGCNVVDESLKLIYEDNGIGIPENEKEKVFQKGYGKNTGLGLYIIEKICEAYEWTIKEEGTPRKGVRFTITIPKGKFEVKTSEDKIS